MELFYWGTGITTALLGLSLLAAFIVDGLDTTKFLILIGCVFWTFYAAAQVF